MAQTGYEPHGLKKGQQITGVISSISPKEILIDIGAKTEGLVLEKDRRLYNDLLSKLTLGDKITAVVISAESEYGYPVLSLRRQMMDQNWNKIIKSKEKGEDVDVAVVDITRGGLLVEAMGIRGFIPLSHLGSSDKPELLVGKKIKAKILDFDRRERRLVFSQKSTRGDTAGTKALFEKLEIDREYEGKVSGITTFGIFVKIEIPGEKTGKSEVEGLVHISEISWEKVDDINRLFKLGDSIKVILIGIDKDNLKLNLSLKKLMEDPWEKVAASFSKDQTVMGKISKISSIGIFVVLTSGVEGLIHKSKAPLDAALEVGDKIECVVESVDLPKRRIALVPLLKAKPVGYR